MRTAALLLCTVLAGCVPGIALRSEHVLTGAAGAPFAGKVRIVMEGAPAPAGAEEVAIVSATGSGLQATLPAVLGQLQAEAASLGCDAVIRVRYDHGTSSASATGVAVRTR